MQWNAPPPLEMMPGVGGAIISTLPPLELRTGGISTLGNLQGGTLFVVLFGGGENRCLYLLEGLCLRCRCRKCIRR